LGGLPKSTAKKTKMESFFRDCSLLTEKCSLKPFTWLERRQIHWALEVQKYVGAPTASHLRQTRQPVDPGLGLDRQDKMCFSTLEGRGSRPSESHFFGGKQLWNILTNR